MHSEFEDMIKKFQKLLDENDADVLNGDDLDDLFARFSEQMPDESTAGEPEPAEDYIELASRTFSDKQRS